jgi:uncharacterized membrane protein YbhN (UPF0104 family)
MVSRQRLHHLGATFAAWATTKRVRMLAQILLVAGLVFVVIRVRALWHGGNVELANIDWLAIVASVVVAAVGTAAAAAIWLVILEALGLRTHRWWTGIFFQAQLAKYIPGSIWQYAGRAAIARTQGVPVRPVGVSMPVEFAASAIAAGSMAALLLGWWGVAVIVALGLLLVGLERPARSRGRPAFATVRATILYQPAWLLLGVSFWLCARGLVNAPVEDLAIYIGAFAVAWLAGLLAIYAPGGLGVREAVLVALLSSRLGAADALVVAAASRLSLILVDVVLAGFGFLLLRKHGARSPGSGTSASPVPVEPREPVAP